MVNIHLIILVLIVMQHVLQKHRIGAQYSHLIKYNLFSDVESLPLVPIRQLFKPALSLSIVVVTL